MNWQVGKILNRNRLRTVPTALLFAVSLGALLLSSVQESAQPIMFNWSAARVLLLLLLFVCTTYFFTSLFRRKLQDINNYLCYLVVVVLVAFEVIFRVKPDLIPGPLMIYLPKATIERIRIAVAHKWGYYTGQEMIYHYPPSQQLDYGELVRPHVHIDEEGFRNPSPRADEYEIVLLGDSMVFALDAERDLADRFRQMGFSALNLGMEGYAPQHFRDVYQRYVIDRGIKHDYVLTFLYIGNDFGDAEAYQYVLDIDGDYADYVIGETKEVPYLPLVLNVGRGMFDYLTNYVQDRVIGHIDYRLDINETFGLEIPATSAATFVDEPDMLEGRIIKLPYMTLETHDWMWPPPAITEDHYSWEYVEDGLDAIIASAQAADAKPIFFLLPSPLTIYSEFEVDAPPSNSLEKFDRNHAATSDLLQRYFESQEILYVDLNQPLKDKIRHTFIFVAEDDGHFNDAGLDKVFELVADKLPLQ